MHEQPTQDLSFEERLFAYLHDLERRFEARFQTLEEKSEARAQNTENRLQAIEDRLPERPYDTRPLMERLLKEVADHSAELRALLARFEQLELQQGGHHEQLVALREIGLALLERMSAVEAQLGGLQDEVGHFGHKLEVFNHDQLRLQRAMRDFEKQLREVEKQPV